MQAGSSSGNRERRGISRAGKLVRRRQSDEYVLIHRQHRAVRHILANTVNLDRVNGGVIRGRVFNGEGRVRLPDDTRAVLLPLVGEGTAAGRGDREARRRSSAN